jgi:hypothetical protein
VGFVVDKVALGHGYSVPPANLHSTNCSTIIIIIIIYHPGLVQQASNGCSTKWTQSHPTKKKSPLDNLKERCHFGDLGADKIIIFKRIEK